MKIGKKDAEAAIKLGEGGYMNLMFEYAKKIQEGDLVYFDDMLNSKLAEITESSHIVSD